MNTPDSNSVHVTGDGADDVVFNDSQATTSSSDLAKTGIPVAILILALFSIIGVSLKENK